MSNVAAGFYMHLTKSAAVRAINNSNLSADQTFTSYAVKGFVNLHDWSKYGRI